jgi:hypothetical protein
MVVQGVPYNSHPPHVRSKLMDRLLKDADGAAAPAAQTPPPASEADRAQLLAAIRKRIKKGYYRTDAVLEDLSDSFAAVFDKLT